MDKQVNAIKEEFEAVESHEQESPKAIAAFVLGSLSLLFGILSLLCLLLLSRVNGGVVVGWILGIIGTILGVIACKKSQYAALATSALGLSFFGLVANGAIAVPCIIVYYILGLY